jgi:hypothetical protein
MAVIPSADVPQANSLNVVADLLTLIDLGFDETEELAARLPLASREVSYYKHAARILGFIEVENAKIKLSEEGRKILHAKTPEERKRLFATAVKNAKVFRELLQTTGSTIPSRSAIIEFLSRRADLSESTAGRRADTILAWLRAVS